jgi:hypothetical protein
MPFIRFILFLLAYVPIYIIGALKTLDAASFKDDKGNVRSCCYIIDHNRIPLVLVTLSLLLIIYFFFYFKKGIKPYGTPIFTVKEVTIQHKEYVTYLGTYILPFIALKTNSIFDIIAVALMFLTIGMIYSRTKLIYTNPILIFFGFDIYEVVDDKGNTHDCISKNKIQVGDPVMGRKLGENIFIIEKWKKAN